MLGRPRWLSSLRCQGLVFNIAVHRVLELMSREGGPQSWQLLAGFQPPEAFRRLHHGSPGPAQRHGGIFPAFDVAADAADRAVHVLDDVGAGQRAAQFGRQAQAAGRLRRSFSAFAASFSSHACRNTLRTPACRDLGKRSMILRALWTWQRWIGVWRPKVLRIALESALAPSMTNSRLTFGSRPRSIRLSSRACATTAFSVAPSITPRGCLPPLPSTPTAASSIRSCLMWMPSIWMTSRSSLDRSVAIHSFIRAADSATKRRDTADLDTPEPLGAPMPPSGRRTARPYLS